MKINFRKISAILSSAVMIGATAGMAAAANYPAPFVVDGTADVAIVYGASAGQTDGVEAGNIQTDLQGMVTTSGGTIVVGGESFKLDKSSDHFNFAEAMNGVYSDLDEEQMDFLAEGTYDDGDIDEEYQQKIVLKTKTLSLFADNDYDNDKPTVGFSWTNGQEILDYELDLDDEVLYSDMVQTDMPLLGANYYVLAASTSQIDLLDTADSQVLREGEDVTVTLDDMDYVVSVSVYDNGAKFTVNGAVSDKLTAGGYDEISKDLYVVAKEVNYVSKESGVSDVEFALGKGKIELIDGAEAELNDEAIRGLTTTLTDGSTNSSYFDTIKLTWESYRDSFLTESDSILMPGFDAIQLIYGGLNLPSESEKISLDNGDTLTLNLESFDLPVAWYNSSNTFLGEEDYELVVAISNATNTTWTSPARTVNLTGGLDLEENDRFIVTSIGTDLTDVETMYYEVTTVENRSNDLKIELNDMIGDNDLSFDALESHDRGSLTAELVAVNGTTSGARAYINFTSSDATVYYNKVVSDKGMVITLPTDVSGVNTTGTASITFTEADKDDDLMQGRSFTTTFKASSNEKLHVSTHNLTDYDEEESDDNYVGYVPSDLASKFMFDTSGDEYDFSVEYYGKEVTADVSVATAEAVMSSETQLGEMLVTDAEVASVSNKNLIIVGGSCINSAAATVLGGAYCGPAFTEATGVGAGQFLIKSFADAYTTGKMALVVAGYEAVDTVNAATYLRTQDVDTSKEYKGTSSTSADLVVA